MLEHDQSKHAQKIGLRNRNTRGTQFFRDITPTTKLTKDQARKMIDEFNNRLENGKTVVLIAEKYGVTKSTVYYWARLLNV